MTNGYALEITPQTGRTFFTYHASRDEALAAFEAECAAANRVWVGLHQVFGRTAILIREVDLWAEREAERKAAA